MTIRNRLTLWYACLLLLAFAALGWGLYYELVISREAARAQGREPDSIGEEIRDIMVLHTLPVLVVAIVGGWWLTRRTLQPITTLTEAAEATTLHTLGKRLQRTGKGGRGDELDRLTDVFNKMLARLDESIAHVRDFTLYASHELKTPLTIMRGEMETALEEENCTPAQRELLSMQLEQIQHLTQILDGLLLLAKADAGLLPLERKPVRLDELLADSFTDAQFLARSRGIKVELLSCDQASILADPIRVRQLLLNLIDNAFKYNEPQGRVEFSLQKRERNAELRISNTGPGIPAEQLPRIFQRFYRGDLSHNDAVEGCGLGLSIAQWIVKAHEGWIQIVSEPGKSTTVIVSLPLG